VNVFGPIPHPTVPGEVDPVVASVGREESFPAQYRARVAERLPVPELSPSVACPGGVDIQVSDHCGLFIRLEWDGTEAGALRQSSSRVRAT
jgi:hypothetical protein